MLKRYLILLCLLLTTQLAFAAIVVGNTQGKVTLIEVLDYQCGHCHRMQPMINWLMMHDKDLKIRLIPVAIINKDSLIEATSSYVVAKNTSDFLKYHEFLMSKAVGEKGVADALNSLHVDTKLFNSQMHQQWVLDQMKSGLLLLQKYKSGTPLILIYRTDNPSKKYVFSGESDPRVVIQTIQEITHA